MKIAFLAGVLATVVPFIALAEPYYEPLPSMAKTMTSTNPLLERLAKQSAGKTAEIARVLPQYAIIRREEPAVVAPKGPMLVPDRGYAPWTAREATPGKAPETVVISYGAAGRMDQHYSRYADYKRAKTKVEVRGPCYSACTLVLAYVEDICIAEGAFMAFHAVRSAETGARMDWETRIAYTNMPRAIQGWIDDNGGVDQMPLNSFWTLHDRQLWAMGYPKCTP
jgi:hypothetical protein